LRTVTFGGPVLVKRLGTELEGGLKFGLRVWLCARGLEGVWVQAGGSAEIVIELFSIVTNTLAEWARVPALDHYFQPCLIFWIIIVPFIIECVTASSYIV